MSGGSYDYLFCKEAEELFKRDNVRALEDMEERLIEFDFIDVAKDFRRLIEYIKSASIRVEVLGDQLKELMHDIEWFDSGDIGMDDLAVCVEKYRSGKDTVDALQEETEAEIRDRIDNEIEEAWAKIYELAP